MPDDDFVSIAAEALQTEVRGELARDIWRPEGLAVLILADLMARIRLIDPNDPTVRTTHTDFGPLALRQGDAFTITQTFATGPS